MDNSFRKYSLRYLDSSIRTEDQALGHWIEREDPTSVAHLRLQTGYFSANGLSAFHQILSSLADRSLPISAVVGSNERDTTKSDIEALFEIIGTPRANAQVCVISYSRGLFHPKVVHLTRTDGSQLAYVGSANITPSGVNAGNIEAGVLLDTTEGDPAAMLQEIANRIDSWFDSDLPETNLVTTKADIQRLADSGVLGLTKPPRSSSQGTAGQTSGQSKPALSQLVSFPKLVLSNTTANVAPSSSTSNSSGKTPPQIAASHDVLVAEIGGGPRWKQANFPVAIVQNYFGVNPTASDHIQLHEVQLDGVVGNITNTLVVNVKSQNYRMELSTVAGVSYPTNGRPIGIFRKVAAKEFRYRIFMPDDNIHLNLANYLGKKYAGPSHHLKRVLIDSNELNNLWSDCPV